MGRAHEKGKNMDEGIGNGPSLGKPLLLPGEHVWAMHVQLPVRMVQHPSGDSMPHAVVDSSQMSEAVALGSVWCVRCAQRLHEAWGEFCTPHDVEEDAARVEHVRNNRRQFPN